MKNWRDFGGAGAQVFSPLAHENAFSPIWRENYADFLPPFQLLFFPIVITLNRYLSSLFDFFLFFFSFPSFCTSLSLLVCSFSVLLLLFYFVDVVYFFPLVFFLSFSACSVLSLSLSLSFFFFFFFLNVINIIHLKNNGERNIITKRIFIFDVLLLF